LSKIFLYSNHFPYSVFSAHIIGRLPGEDWCQRSGENWSETVEVKRHLEMKFLVLDLNTCTGGFFPLSLSLSLFDLRLPKKKNSFLKSDKPP